MGYEFDVISLRSAQERDWYRDFDRVNPHNQSTDEDATILNRRHLRQQTEKLFGYLDQDQSGDVGLDEFVSFIQAYKNGAKGPTQGARKNCSDVLSILANINRSHLYTLLDLSGDGTLSHDEFTDGIDALVAAVSDIVNAKRPEKVTSEQLEEKSTLPAVSEPMSRMASIPKTIKVFQPYQSRRRRQKKSKNHSGPLKAIPRDVLIREMKEEEESLITESSRILPQHFQLRRKVHCRKQRSSDGSVTSELTAGTGMEDAEMCESFSCPCSLPCTKARSKWLVEQEQEFLRLRQRRDDVIAAFRCFDVDGDEQMEAEEFWTGVKEAQRAILKGGSAMESLDKGVRRMTEQVFYIQKVLRLRLKDLHRALDKDRSGELDLEELVRGMERLYEQAQKKVRRQQRVAEAEAKTQLKRREALMGGETGKHSSTETSFPRVHGAGHMTSLEFLSHAKGRVGTANALSKTTPW